MNADYGADNMPISLKAKLLLRYDMLRYDMHKVPEKFWRWCAWKLPRKLVYWAAIRLLTYATVGKWSNQIVPDLKIGDALYRWEE